MCCPGKADNGHNCTRSPPGGPGQARQATAAEGGGTSRRNKDAAEGFSMDGDGGDGPWRRSRRPTLFSNVALDIGPLSISCDFNFPFPSSTASLTNRIYFCAFPVPISISLCASLCWIDPSWQLRSPCRSGATSRVLPDWPALRYLQAWVPSVRCSNPLGPAASTVLGNMSACAPCHCPMEK